ncbi:hypothetical protein C6Y40_18850 [Alteromonas alba]|uniref:Uncharacterized protein n=1 Tax=Alteromonas alba TaxID=2079529 RepID=A0A2S9V6D1_9ALTE|nr:hypothetical protein [Alteromonas alba]PRO71983.1 hypothetical protein C6Y40_18850 [Alteromonas alba]
MSQLKHLTLLAGCSLLFSCASAKIAVEVDIYDEDPRVVLPSTPQDNLDLLAQSQVLLLEAASDKQRSQQWKNQVANIYQTLWYSAGGVDDESAGGKKVFGSNAPRHPVRRLIDTINNNDKQEDDALAFLEESLEALQNNIRQYNNIYLAQLQEFKKEYADYCIGATASDEKRSSPLATNTHQSGNGTPHKACFRVIPLLNIQNKNSIIPQLGLEKRNCSRNTNGSSVIVRNCVIQDKEAAKVLLTESQFIKRKLALGDVSEALQPVQENAATLTCKNLFQCQNHIQQALAGVIAAYDSYVLTADILVDWAPVESLIQAKMVQAHNNKLEQQRLRNLLSSSQQKIQLLHNKMGADNQQKLDKARSSKNSLAQLQRGEVEVSFVGLKREMPLAGSIREQLAEQARNTSGLYYLIDRLQDVGDPVWRTITNPLNEHHWNKKVSKTFVKAQGDTSMVIVRDNPLHFRAHHVRNDPSALIKGQLEIARAIGDAALTIAGVKLGGRAALTGSAPEKESIELTSVTPAGNAEKQKRQVAQKQKVLNAMTNQLRVLQRELETLTLDEPDDDKQKQKFEARLKSLRNRIIGLLQGYKVRFEVAQDA